MPRIPPDVKSIFGRALEIESSAGRAAYLEDACGDDAGLRAEVDGLLATLGRAGEFMRRPAAAEVTSSYEPVTEAPGTVIGSYKLLQQIGEGGMGSVFMAEQTQPVQRKVALKIIKPGMDSRQVIARFEAERQALAIMDHQNIARVLDAGTTASGRPYFVMELVHGVPITQFCDERKLTLRERLELFVPVCQAIQHAHQKGIIHRDVKPSNILVTMYDDKPVPKVIDFGVAKAIEQRLTEKTMFTQFGALVGTFEYMSPEQAEMNAFGVDTRSDIYSLGVLLYELLTGTTPLERPRLRRAALDEMVRLIKEEEAPRPSIRLSSSDTLPKIAAERNTEPARLSRLVRGEIDWIVMKCLEKDRTRRYESAGGLARDIQRHLPDEPVEACPPSAGYRLRKFARKYKTPLRVAGAFLVLLVLGAIASTWQAVRATVAERAAQEREREADDAKAQSEKRRDEVVSLNDTLRRAKYIADMNLARIAWDENNVIRTRELLEQHRPQPGAADPRGFEWHYLRRLYDQEIAIIKAHGGAALTVAYTPDGKRLITSGTMNPGSESVEVKLWDAATGRRHALELKGPMDKVSRVALSRDGKLLAAGSMDKAACVWNLDTGEFITLGGSAKPRPVPSRVSFSPSGKLLASREILEYDVFGNNTEISIWDLADRKAVVTIAKVPVIWGAPVFSPNEKYVAACCWFDGAIVWDAATGVEAFRCKYGEGKMAAGVAFDRDGQRLIMSGEDGIHVFDVATRQRVAVWPSDCPFGTCLALSPDGSRLAAGGNGGLIELWETGTGERVDTFRGHAGMVESLAFSPDGARLASSGMDGSVRAWDTNRARVALPIPATAPGRAGLGLELTTDGQTVVTGIGSNTVRLWNSSTGQPRAGPFEHQHNVLCVNLTPDGKRLFVADKGKNVKIWDVASRMEIHTFPYDAELVPLAGYISPTAMSPDGKWYALPAKDGTIKLCDAVMGIATRSIRGSPGESLPLEFSPDGSHLGGGSAETVTVWDVATGEETAATKVSGMSIVRVRFSPDGRRLAVIGHNRFLASEARIMDPDGGHAVVLKGHALAVLDVAFCPDGKRVATASTDKTVRIWDLASGQELLMLKGHTGPVLSLRFSSDGRRLITAAADRTIRVWDATPLPEEAR